MEEGVRDWVMTRRLCKEKTSTVGLLLREWKKILRLPGVLISNVSMRWFLFEN